MAQRLVPRRFDPDLDREAGEKADADKPSRPAGGDDQGCTGRNEGDLARR